MGLILISISVVVNDCNGYYTLPIWDDKKDRSLAGTVKIDLFVLHNNFPEILNDYRFVKI